MKFLLVLLIIILIVAAAIGFYKTQTDEPTVSDDVVIHTEKKNPSEGNNSTADNSSTHLSRQQSREYMAQTASIHQKILEAVAQVPLPPAETITDNSLNLIPLTGTLVDVDKTYPPPVTVNPSDYLKDFTKIDDKIIPKKVAVKEALVLNVDMDGQSSGSVTVQPNTEVDVKEVKPDQIVISAGIATATIDANKTDFLARVDASYKKNFTEATETITRQRQAAEQSNQQILQLRKQYADTVGMPPEKRADGIIPAVLHGLLINGAPNIDPKDIINYGDVRFEVIGNQPYWTVQIEISPSAQAHMEHRTQTPFGTRIDVDQHPPTKALIRMDRVIRWVSTDA